MPTPFTDQNIAAVFDALPESQRLGMLALRDLIFEVAAETPQAGRVEEVLRWGQPSYITPDKKSGSTIRLGALKTGGFAIYTHCQSTLLSDFQTLFPDDFIYEGNRAVHFENEGALEADKIALLIKSALTYHLKP